MSGNLQFLRNRESTGNGRVKHVKPSYADNMLAISLAAALVIGLAVCIILAN